MKGHEPPLREYGNSNDEHHALSVSWGLEESKVVGGLVYHLLGSDRMSDLCHFEHNEGIPLVTAICVVLRQNLSRFPFLEMRGRGQEICCGVLDNGHIPYPSIQAILGSLG